ncbi:hypothetical protein BCR25_06970 [Enterococcus termitis]|uniref:Alternate signal-mediated exported protein n=1 Tax=Enterococcus termitis TaxID=332950 RepID=A0A1E5GIJ2_9ENTE|nr:hypothetical protein BCR25_06970 [Enterococcus termitis]
MLLLSTLTILVCLGIGMYQTYAALTGQDSKENNFKIADFKTSIEEDFQPSKKFEADIDYKKIVRVKNDGEDLAFVRVLVSPVITTKDTMTNQTILLPATMNGSAPVLSIDFNDVDWIDGQDGFYYYKQALKTGEKTSSLFEKVRMNSQSIDTNYTGAILTFELKVESVNTTAYAYRDAWWNGQKPTVGVLLPIDQVLEPQVIKE